MSSSRTLSRCVVTLEAMMGGELLGLRIDAAATRIEVLFDDLEKGGRHFVKPTEPGFKAPKVTSEKRGDETCRVEFLCAPALTRAQTKNLALRVAELLAAPLHLGDLPDLTPRALPVQRPAGGEPDTDPGDGPPRPDDVATRTHGRPATSRREDAPTRPEGVISVRAKRKSNDDAGEPEEVTVPQNRDELPTKPEGVMAIKRTRKN